MILIISSTKESASCISEMTFYMGMLSYGVDLGEAFSELSDLYKAAIILSPSKIPSPESYLKELSPYLNGIPLFAFGETDEKLSHYFSRTFPQEESLGDALMKISRYALENNLPSPSEYRLAGLDLSPDLSEPSYFYTPIPLTRTQAMIVRFLIRSYPTPATAEQILKYAYKESRVPEISNVRTHLSIINKKFREKTSRNLIMPVFKRGYVIMTPEMIHN